MFKIDGHTKQLGIIGYPIEHTMSPNMHNYISGEMNRNYTYSAWKVHPDDLGRAIDGMRALGIRGINVTSPHKTEVMKYLDKITGTAMQLGSVNTVVNDNGTLVGYNTDADGFCMSLGKEGIEINGSRILIIGAGGVTRPTIMRLIGHGAEEITVANRTMEKAVALAENIYEATGFKVRRGAYERHYDIVINTTSAGMEPQEDILPTDSVTQLRDLSFIDDRTAAVDMIYNPPETLFLKEAKKRGAKTLNGLGMLIYQGIIAYELFTGEKLPDDMGERIKRGVFGG